MWGKFLYVLGTQHLCVSNLSPEIYDTIVHATAAILRTPTENRLNDNPLQQKISGQIYWGYLITSQGYGF